VFALRRRRPLAPGGNSANVNIGVFTGYQIPFAERVKQEVMPSGAVGRITEANYANSIVEEGKADLVLVGRKILNDPYWPIRAAKELNYKDITIPPQYAYAGLNQ